MILKSLLVFFTAFIVSAFTMPNIIRIAVKRLLFDEHTEARKIHTKDISNLGGIGIFTGFFFCILLFQIVCDSRDLGSLSAGAVLLFFVALKDDLTPSSPIYRLVFQCLIACIIVFLGQVHFAHIPCFDMNADWKLAINIVCSILFIVGMINATNFIDGIDGLAGTLGLIICLFFGLVFYLNGDMAYCYTAWALAGAILGFLLFNFSPAKIFMGDMGSMLIGVFITIFGIKVANMGVEATQPVLGIVYPGSVMLSVLMVPIMDMVTVCLIRLYLGLSPLKADKRHLHHRLLGLGFSHPAICFTIGGFNLLCMVISLLLQPLGSALWPVLSTLLLAAAFEGTSIVLFQRKQSLEQA